MAFEFAGVPAVANEAAFWLLKDPNLSGQDALSAPTSPSKGPVGPGPTDAFEGALGANHAGVEVAEGNKRKPRAYARVCARGGA